MNRSHHPDNDISLKEFNQKLFDAEKEFTRESFRNISKQFEQQEKNVAFALASQKELAFNTEKSSKEAISKAEDAQRTYNQGHNDLSRKMEEQYRMMLPRTESEQQRINQEEKLEAHRKELAELRSKIEAINIKGGVMEPMQNKTNQQFEDMRGTKAQGISMVIFAIGLFLTMLISIFSLILQFKNP